MVVSVVAKHGHAVEWGTDMKHIRSLEVGVQRIYYVLWFIFTSGMLYSIYTVIDDGKVPISAILAFWISIAVLGPYVVMLAIRWIYRGFVPIKVDGTTGR